MSDGPHRMPRAAFEALNTPKPALQPDPVIRIDREGDVIRISVLDSPITLGMNPAQARALAEILLRLSS